MALTIPNWDDRFETAQSRAVHSLSWLPLKLSFGAALRMQEPKVAAAMMQVVFLAATMPKRGTFNDGGRDLTIDDIASCVGADSTLIAKAMSALGASSPSPEENRDKREDRENRESGHQHADGTLSDAPLRGAVDTVLGHYRNHHPRFRGAEKERRLVAARLKDGWTPEDLCAAIDGNHRSPFHRGENDRGQKYHALGLILRDGAHVQEFIDIPANGHVPSERVSKALRVGENWLAMKELQDGEQGPA